MADEPIQPEFRAAMNSTAAALDQIFNGDKRGKDRKVGFVLLTFPFGEAEGGRCNYISNADKADMLAFFKFQVARIEGRLQEEKKTQQ